MGKAFSDLERRYQDFMRFKGDINSLNNEDPLKKYIKWRQWDDPSKHKIPSENVPSRNGSNTILLHPFALDYNAGSAAIFIGQRVTGRAYTFFTTGAGQPMNTKLQIQSATRADDAVQLASSPLLQAAKISVSQVLGTPKSVPASRITGRSYKTNRGNSYTCGFGKKDASDSYDDRRKDLLTVLPSGYTASFIPEVYKLPVAKIAKTTP